MPRDASTYNPVLAAVIALLLAGWLSAATLQTLYNTPGTADMSIFAEAGMRFWQGEPIYERQGVIADRYRPTAPIFKFPPPYLLPYLPWLQDGIPTYFYQGLFLSLVLLYAATAGWLGRSLLASAPAASPLGPLAIGLALVALLSAGFYNALNLLAPEIPIFALLASAVVLGQRWPGLAGLLIGHAAAIKLYPAYLFCLPLMTGRWHMLAGCLAGLSGSLVISVAVFGTAEHTFYLQTILPILLQEPILPDPFNFNLVRDLHALGWLESPSRDVMRAWQCLVAAGLALALWSSRQRRDLLALQCGASIAAMLLTLANSWEQYQLLLVITLMALLAHCGLRDKWLCLLVPPLLCQYSWAEEWLLFADFRGNIPPDTEMTSLFGFTWTYARTAFFLFVLQAAKHVVLPALWAYCCLRLWRAGRTSPPGNTLTRQDFCEQRL